MVGEGSLFARTGGAPSLAVGIAHIFSGTLGGKALMAIWYHFAIMFEALFILTVLDAGSRVGRFLLQDLLGHFWKPLGRTSWYPSVFLTSGLIVGAWGYFLYQGVTDPLGGINSLWPLFGIANQLLAVVALSVGTTILIKMNKARFAWVTLIPMIWLVPATQTAGYQKMFHPGSARRFPGRSGRLSGLLESGKIAAGQVAATERLIFNNRLDAAVTALFALLVIVIVLDSAREWLAILRRRKTAGAVRVRLCGFGVGGRVAMKFLRAVWTVLTELSGEADYRRYCAHLRAHHPIGKSLPRSGVLPRAPRGKIHPPIALLLNPIPTTAGTAKDRPIFRAPGAHPCACKSGL